MTRATLRVSACVACVIAGVVGVVVDARADLRGDAGRVAEQWRGAGATVSIAAPRFLSEDETVSLLLPRGEGECVSVALVGARGMSFHAKISGADDADGDDHATRAASVAGALSISRCGGSPMRRLVLVSDAGRGTVETVVGYAKSALPPLRYALPERTGGAIPAAPDPGELPVLPAPEKRADVAETRARRDGGSVQARVHWQAGTDGGGSNKLVLAPGCHRIELFAPDARQGRARRGKLDVDAELRDEVDDRLLARDRSDAPDAHLETCVGEETHANVVFAGSAGDAQILVTHLTWPIPQHVPQTWGPDARARMAHVLLVRHIAAPQNDPVMLASGGAQITPVPIALEPGACYVAVVAVVQGQPKGVGLRVTVGARESSDDRGSADSAGVVAFCAIDKRRALVEVDARGTGMAWGLAIFRVTSRVWEIPR